MISCGPRISSTRTVVFRARSCDFQGEHSVGVDQAFDPHLDRAFYGQQTFGVWFAYERLSTPVTGGCCPAPGHAPRRTGARNERVGGLDPEGPEGYAVAAVVEDVRTWDVPPRPVVMDICSERAATAVRSLTDARMPVIARRARNARFVAGIPRCPRGRADP